MVSMGMRLPCKRHCGIKMCRRQDLSPWCLRLTVHSSLLMANIFRDMKVSLGLVDCAFAGWAISHIDVLAIAQLNDVFFSSKLHHWLCFSGILWFTYNNCNFLSLCQKKGFCVLLSEPQYYCRLAGSVAHLNVLIMVIFIICLLIW